MAAAPVNGVVNENDPCVGHVIAASQAENEAIELDRAGDVQAALRKYEESERELAAAIAAALPAHADDQPKLIQHRQEVLDRIRHLKSLRSGALPSIPVEQQIKAVQLGMQATSAANAAASQAGGVKTLAACAALGAAGGFVVLGGLVGSTAAVVGGAAGAAYVATRQDTLGSAARSAGGMAIKGAEKAQELNREHRITHKIAEAGSKGAARAQEVNVKYGISDKVTKGVSSAVAKAKDIDEKHHVTNRMASGLASGFGKLSAALDKKPKQEASGSAPGPQN